MADIHILGGAARPGTGQARKTCVFHFAIPANLREPNAALDPDLIAFVSAVPDITQGELDAIKAGDIVEVVTSVSIHFDNTPAERLALVRARYSGMKTSVIRSYQIKYYEYTSTFTES